MNVPNCPSCQSQYTYEDGSLFVCPECAHEWGQDEKTESTEEQLTVKDANGNLLKDGDSVTVIKDLKVKGSSSVVKIGTKVKSIRLVEGLLFVLFSETFLMSFCFCTYVICIIRLILL